jgi:Protein of unknown function (DUF3467)
MSTPSDPENQPPKDGGDPQTFTQEFQFGNLGARVPEKVARGVFATGALVIQGATEFVLDFLLRMNQPHQVVARVILPINLVPQLIDALRTNLENYRKTHGAAPAAPPTPAAPVTPAAPPSIEEIYQDLKMSDDVMAGAYANTIMVVHNASEFCLEFISKVYPRPVITARVFLSAPQVPVLLNSLGQSWQNLQAKLRQQQPPPHQNP